MDLHFSLVQAFGRLGSACLILDIGFGIYGCKVLGFWGLGHRGLGFMVVRFWVLGFRAFSFLDWAGTIWHDKGVVTSLRLQLYDSPVV